MNFTNIQRTFSFEELNNNKPKTEEELLNLILDKKQYYKNLTKTEDKYLLHSDYYDRIALIDADYIPYKVAHITDNLLSAYNIIYNILYGIMLNTKSSHFILFHTTSCNFRTNVADNYKENRKDTNVKTEFYYEVRNMMKTLWNSCAYKCYEADDLVTMSHLKIGQFKSVIVSPDKDLLQVYPSVIYNPNKNVLVKVNDKIGSLNKTTKQKINKKTGAVRNLSKITGKGTKFLFWQLLVGDSTDNIKGIPGVGAVKAYDLLNNCTTLQEMLDTCKDAYNDYYNNKGFKMLKMNFELLYMQTKDTSFKIPKPLILI